jgi:hypothetical protein
VKDPSTPALRLLQLLVGRRLPLRKHTHAYALRSIQVTLRSSEVVAKSRLWPARSSLQARVPSSVTTTRSRYQPPRFYAVGGVGGLTRSSITINKVATGPINSEIRKQASPLRLVLCASPALISARVPQPTNHSCRTVASAVCGDSTCLLPESSRAIAADSRSSDVAANASSAVQPSVRSTAGMTYEAHIDDARALAVQLQTQRFVWCIPLLGCHAGHAGSIPRQPRGSYQWPQNQWRSVCGVP